ncbi:hypothetical protein GCM10010174_20610 [Kutzneria viridogrisea]|uniref:Uncharacterized protein n=2 Tax=Kutzneria TaxID=43356 RepID=W5WEZ2_9PSEU|nr:hypothetical protein [Kutzneria albida]AHH99422.1 hypothetical protein KALB_6062 [Kutzneria albida DSM 43870]MBA8923021.1 hypothetical protein [Kutzneria viridogrisea]
MPDQSFAVHLESLTRFAEELRTQLDGVGKPMDQLAGLAGKPVLLGDFGEALSLHERTRAAIGEMHGLLDQVRQAIEFAQNVTKTVATGYERLDEDISAGMRVSADYTDSGLVGGVVGGVLDTVSGVLGDGED